MAIPSNIIIFIVIIHLTLIFSQEQDGLCPRIRSILCVNHTLFEISSATKKINDIGQQIEQTMYEREQHPITLDKYVDHKMQSIRSNLPSKYHHEYMHVHNNINRTGFINMIQEENYAFSYLYNSLNNIIKNEYVFSRSTDKSSMKKIRNILRKDILCNYRNILHVYSAKWLSLDEINGIQILILRKRSAPSLIYNGDSITVIRLLQEWIKNVNEFVSNIESKLY